MSVESLSVVLHHSQATGTAKLVLLGIANHDGDGGAWPSLRTLSVYANVDPRNVRMALRRLEDLGELRIKIQAGGRPDLPDYRRTNYYELLVACPDWCDRSSQHRDSRRTDGPLWTGRDPRTPASPAPRTATSPAPRTATSPAPRTPASSEPSEEPSPDPDLEEPGSRSHSSHGEWNPGFADEPDWLMPAGVQPSLLLQGDE